MMKQTTTANTNENANYYYLAMHFTFNYKVIINQITIFFIAYFTFGTVDRTFK